MVIAKYGFDVWHAMLGFSGMHVLLHHGHYDADIM